MVYYGGLPNPPENLKGIQSPVLGFFGEDESERATQLEQIISSSDKPVEVHIYEGASHGFYNDSNPRGFNFFPPDLIQKVSTCWLNLDWIVSKYLQVRSPTCLICVTWGNMANQ